MVGIGVEVRATEERRTTWEASGLAPRKWGPQGKAPLMRGH